MGYPAIYGNAVRQGRDGREISSDAGALLRRKESAPDAVVKQMKVKLDPGSKATWIALLDADCRVMFAAELSHSWLAIRDAIESRRALRRGRCNRNTRYS